MGERTDSPETATGLCLRAQALNDVNRHAEALPLLQQAIAADP